MTEYTDENNICTICYDRNIKYSYQCNFHHVCDICYWMIDKCPYCQALRKPRGTRSFKVKLERDMIPTGRYNGDSPYQAANKALSEIIRNRIKNNEPIDGEIIFYLVESTKGSTKKEHMYVGERIKLENPVSYAVNNDQIITKEYNYILRKVKLTAENQNQTQ